MNRPTSILLAITVTAVTVPAVPHWGPIGVLASAAGFGVGYGLVIKHTDGGYP